MNTPLQTTLADLTAAQIDTYYAAPDPDAGSTSPSTDPAVYVSDPTYIRELNRHAFHRYAVDVPNKHAADQLDFVARQWQSAKSATNIPKPGEGSVPGYVTFDDAAFNQWWAQYMSNIGANAPPFYFIKPAALPPDIVIIADGAKPQPIAPATDGPVGAAVPNNPGVFTSSGNDFYADGFIYAGQTGIYQKHVYANPFTVGNVRIIWIKLQ